MVQISISAADTLFFGNGRPFTMGENSWTRGIFPPYPETLYGFLRGCYFIENMKDIGNAMTNNDPTRGLRINNFGLFLREGDSPLQKLFPFPNDIVENKETGQYELLACEHSNEEIFSNNPFQNDWRLIYKGNAKARRPDETCYLTETDFVNYLHNKIQDITPIKLSKVIAVESKIGIYRDRFRKEKQELYRILTNRMETLNTEILFWIEYEGLNLSSKIINRMGGEGKLVFIDNSQVGGKVYNNTLELNIGDIVRLYLSTPALFETDWKPDIDNAEILTAAIGKPLSIGGFDAKNRIPKPMQKAVPAGSVYYLQIQDKNLILPPIIGKENEKGYGRAIYSKIQTVDNHIKQNMHHE